jgi:hypothetical protein
MSKYSPEKRTREMRLHLLVMSNRRSFPEFQPHDIVIMGICRQAIEAAAASLPAYSPDFTSQECANCLAAAGYDATSTENALIVDTALVAVIDVAAEPVRVALAWRVRRDV